MGGRFSHAVTKAAMLPAPVVHLVDGGRPRALYLPEDIRATTPTPAESAVARAALGAVPHAGDLVYARVDLLPGPDGPVVVELELTEPSLFLDQAAGAADRLAAVIAHRVRAQPVSA